MPYVSPNLFFPIIKNIAVRLWASLPSVQNLVIEENETQILLLHYLNKVHFNAPTSPLELEIYHQMRNIISIDPMFYEYILTVDADTVRI